MLRHIGIGLLGIAAFFAFVWILGFIGAGLTLLAHFAIPIILALIVVFFVTRHFRKRSLAGGINPNPFAYIRNR